MATQKKTPGTPTTGTKTTKTDRLIAALSAASGATLDDLTKVTGWQAHSVRGAISGVLKKKGLKVVSEKTDGTRRYRIVS